MKNKPKKQKNSNILQESQRKRTEEEWQQQSQVSQVIDDSIIEEPVIQKERNPGPQNGIPTFEEVTHFDPDNSDRVVQQPDYSKLYKKNDDDKPIQKVEPIKQQAKPETPPKKTEPPVQQREVPPTGPISSSTDVVDPERVILPEGKNRDEVTDMICTLCKQFPLSYETCTECKKVFCKNCINGKNKCPNCNSIYKAGPPEGRVQNLFSVAKIKCTYYDLGCQQYLPVDQLKSHENQCEKNQIKCKFCWKDFSYKAIEAHWKTCDKNMSECAVCGYKDLPSEFEKNHAKLEHTKHVLMPGIKQMIQSEMNVYNANIKKMIDSIPRSKDNPSPSQPVAQMQAMEEKMKNDRSSNNNNHSGFPSEPDKNLRNIELLSTLVTDIDNSFESDKKFVVVATFKQEYLVIYPTLKYEIQAFNLSTQKKGQLIKKAHDSSIICMANVHDTKKSLTYFASTSFDRSIKIWCIENDWKLVTKITDAHKDYSIFAIEMIYNNDTVTTISGNYTNKEVKIWKLDGTCEGTINCKNHVSSISCKLPTGLFIGTDAEIEQYELPSKKLVKSFTATPKSKHTSIAISDDNLVECDSIGKLRVWSISSGQMIHQIERGILKHQINSVCSWDSRYVICGTRDNRIMLYDIAEGFCIDQLGTHNGYVYCVKVVEHWKNYKVIISSGFDGQLKLWGAKQ